MDTNGGVPESSGVTDNAHSATPDVAALRRSIFSVPYV